MCTYWGLWYMLATFHLWIRVTPSVLWSQLIWYGLCKWFRPCLVYFDSESEMRSTTVNIYFHPPHEDLICLWSFQKGVERWLYAASLGQCAVHTCHVRFSSKGSVCGTPASTGVIPWLILQKSSLLKSFRLHLCFHRNHAGELNWKCSVDHTLASLKFLIVTLLHAVFLRMKYCRVFFLFY